jgi:membrane associated rhomboid family serine protease
LTGGLWRRADTLEHYQFFRRSGEEERREQTRGAEPPPPFADLPAVAFPRRGLSGTEILLGLNLGVALLLLLLWQDRYSPRLWDLAWRFYDLLAYRDLPLGLIPTLFMHADLGHLGANMITLVPSAAFVEYLHGRRVLLIYLLGGIGGALASYGLKGHGPMSVGASGAIYALIGALAAFLMRYHPRLGRWARWRARRVYFPLVVLVTLPALFRADWLAHTGGFVSGILLGLLLPLAERGRAMLLPSDRQSA